MANGAKKSGKPGLNVFTAFGALKPKRKFVSIEEETEGMEKAVGRRIGLEAPTGRTSLSPGQRPGKNMLRDGEP
jgi:hypothetical protein